MLPLEGYRGFTRLFFASGGISPSPKDWESSVTQKKINSNGDDILLLLAPEKVQSFHLSFPHYWNGPDEPHNGCSGEVLGERMAILEYYI